MAAASVTIPESIEGRFEGRESNLRLIRASMALAALSSPESLPSLSIVLLLLLIRHISESLAPRFLDNDSRGSSFHEPVLSLVGKFEASPPPYASSLSPSSTLALLISHFCACDRT